MTSRIAYPTLVFSNECVLPSGWDVVNGKGVVVSAGDYLPDWDYAVLVPLQRRLQLDWSKVTQALECGPDVQLACVLRVGTGMGRLPRSIIHQVRHELSCDCPEATFDLKLRGDKLSTTLDLTIDIILEEGSDRSADLTPVRRGSRLWRETTRIRLEGEEPRFPIEVADFRVLLGNTVAARSPWYLHWSPRDWSRDFHGSMRLYLNAAHRDLVGRVEAEDAEVLRALMAEVMGQVCECLLRDPEAQGHFDTFEQNSLGFQARNWLKLAFPRSGYDQAVAVLESRPGEFRAAFQAVADMGGDA